MLCNNIFINSGKVLAFVFLVGWFFSPQEKIHIVPYVLYVVLYVLYFFF